MSDARPEQPWLDLALAPWRLALQTWPASLAPQSLTQPINPGWSFGNVINVTEQNSTAPDTEQEILRHHSYGRQIGRMMDAVALLLEHAPAPVKGEARAQALRQVVQDIDAIKQAQQRRRVDRLRDELLALKRSDPKAWKALAAALREA